MSRGDERRARTGVTASAPHGELAGAAGAARSGPVLRTGGPRPAARRPSAGAKDEAGPRPVPVTVWRRVDADIATAFAVIVPIELASIFRGYGPLPAVRRTEGDDSTWGSEGQERTVVLADGGRLLERCTEVREPGLFRYEVVPVRGMLRLVVRRIDGRFVLSESEAGGTVVRWTYVFRPRHGAAPLVRAIAPMWRRYARQVMDRIAEVVAERGAGAA